MKFNIPLTTALIKKLLSWYGANSALTLNYAAGDIALNSNVSGQNNVAVGREALVSSTTATQNTAVGFRALAGITTGSFNVALGVEAGGLVAVGGFNTLSSTSVYIGELTKAATVSDTNSIVIGYEAISRGSNTTVIGNSSSTAFYAYGAPYAVIGGVDKALELQTNKDASGGYAGLTLFKLNLRNAANTFTSFLTNACTAARTWTMPDYDCTIAGKVSDSLILKSTASAGVKVDEASPDYGYADLRGHFTVDTSGTNAPAIATFDTGDEMLGYNASDISRWAFHVEHRDTTGGSKGLHIHFKKARGTTAATTNLVFTCVVKHSYHHFTGQTARGSSPSPITVVFTITPTEFNAVPDGSTGVTPDIEIFNEGGTGGKLNSLNILPDDDISVTITVTTIPTITGGATNRVAIPHCDIHRQVRDGSGTKYSNDIAGSFYGTN